MVAEYGDAERLLQSEVFTVFFKELSLLMSQVLPINLVCHLEKFDAEARVQKIQDMRSDVTHMEERVSFQTFLLTYMPKISSDDQFEHDLITYLGEENTFHNDLNKATHLDIKDMIGTLKKGILKQLYFLVQQSQSEVLDMEFRCRSIKKQLTSYEWICQLSCIQLQVKQLIQMGQSRPLKSCELSEIGIDHSIEGHLPNDDVIKLLHHYAVLKCEKSEKMKHSVFNVKAANLSLKDLLNNPELIVKFEHSNEVRFLCTDCFYIDTSIDATTNPSFAAKNFAISAPKVCVVGDCFIDLSGVDGVDGPLIDGKEKADDGQISSGHGPGEHGSHGEHGTPGQSGGNILILTDQLINSEQLTLQSCGGNGGNGQNGGDGQDGIAKPSYEDTLSVWPNDFARILGARAGRAHREIMDKITSSGYRCLANINEGNGADYVCSEASNGVRLLFATVNDHYLLYLCRYGFLLSKSKDGESADGGNSGRGGKGGGGGQGGFIEILTLDGRPYSNHGITIEMSNGQDGKPGKSGKCGKRAIAERKPDHLHVDGAGWGTTETHHVFIDMKSWDRSSKTGELGSGKYYCRKEASRKIDSSIDSNHVGFFRASRSSHCPTKHNRQAEQGKANDQSQIITTTKTRGIDKAAINIDYQLFASHTLNLEDRSVLLQALEQLEHRLHEELEELETFQEKQHHKQLRRSKCQEMASSVGSLDVKPVSKCMLTGANIPFQEEKLNQLVGNPLISQDQIEIFQSNGVTSHEKYRMIKDIIQFQLDNLKKHVGDDDTYSHKDPSLLATLKEKWKSIRFSLSCTDNICSLLDALFVPIVQVMRFEHTRIIDNTVEFLTIVRGKCHSKFVAKMDAIRETVYHLLLKQYRWCVLAEIHDKCVTSIPLADPMYQSKLVAVHQGVSKLKTIKELKRFALSLDVESDFAPYSKPLPEYSSSCIAPLPLSLNTQKGLELLTVFINEMNSYIVYIPDILRAVQAEYTTYLCTANDTDLLFIMSYLQEKLMHLPDKTQLEELFYDKLLLKIKSHTLNQQDFIVCDGQTYQMISISTHFDEVVVITMKLSDTMEQAQSEILQLKVHITDSLDKVKVTLDDIPITFPDEVLFVSPVNVDEIWSQLHQSIMEGGRIPNDSVLRKISLPKHVDDEYKDHLISILCQARAAQDIPYDIFSFYPPTQWVEQLIVYVVKMRYLDHHPNFVADVEKAVNGLSGCLDKTLYFTFINQFLLSEDNHHVKDILEVLHVMKSVFIDRKLCTLVTQQGIGLAWSHLFSEVIFYDLQETGLMDGTGSFLSNVTQSTIETYCKARHLSPMDYLKNSCTVQQHCNSLTDKELTFWNHKLHELCLRLDLQDVVDGNTEDSMYHELIMYSQMLIRLYNNDTFSKFMVALSSMKAKTLATKLCYLLKKCASKEWIFEIVIQEILQNKAEPLSVILDNLKVYDWESERKATRHAAEIITYIQSQLPEDLHDKLDDIIAKVEEIKAIESGRKQSQFTALQLPPICKYSKKDIKHWAQAFRESATLVKVAPFDHPQFAEAFAVMCRAITIFYDTEKGKKGVSPRDTQLVASLLFFQNLSTQGGASQGTRLMQQISTGEGKTMIICMTAILKVLLGEKVDIVTSSSVLATRDATEQNPLYGLFGISVSHCCHEELTRRCQAYESDVIYGDIGSFQRDILETYFYDRMIRTAHAFDNVFIDEVDSMLVDKGETMLYLPHALPDLNALDHVFLEIWTLVNAQDFFGFPDEQDQLHNYLTCKLFGGLNVNAFTAISDISEQQSADIHRSCINVGLINQENHCLSSSDHAEIVHRISTIGVTVLPLHLQQEVLLIIQEHLESLLLIEAIPKPLHSFVKRSLRSWIQSAVNAKHFRPNKEYIIDIDHRESAADRYPRIIIMDNETGVEQESSEWGSGLHQFLQLKHNLRLSTESLKAVYMSNISFFTQHYANIMGVTGTLGSTAEHSLFSKLYEDTELVVLPTNKPSRLHIDPPQCCPSPEKWEATIDADIQEKINQGRAVLLICEDVERARHLSHYMKKKYPLLDSELYISSYQQKLEETGERQPKQLIIATNLAGRGTDIKLNSTVKSNGGLHVCLSYLPPNIRVEQQAYGRAARSGDPGSCKLIFFDEEDDLSYAIRKRDLYEAQRVAEIEADYYHNIRFQEELFKWFTVEYKRIKDKYKDKQEGRPELDYCLDCWAYFLDQYTDLIESLPKKVTGAERKLEKDRIIRAYNIQVKEAIAQMELSPARLMQQGHRFMKQAVKRGNKFKDTGNKVDYEKAIKCYQQAFAQYPGNPFAKYYEAAAKLNSVFRNKNTTFDKGKSDRSELKQAFYQLIPMFQNRVKQCQSHIATLQLANRHRDQSLTGGVRYFDEQKQHEMEIYHQYIESMRDIIGRDITSNAFDHVDWGESGAGIIFKTVKQIIPLKECRVSHNYSHRLETLLQKEGCYHTFESKIKNRVQSLVKKKPVTRHDFEEVFPDKHRFWDQLKFLGLITHEKITKEDDIEHKIGYWNPTADTEEIQFKTWDCINEESFDWIHGLSRSLRRDLVDHLKVKHVLNCQGQLIDLDLSKPLHLPNVYTPHYKHIKDTLWTHSIYRFVLDHLRKCIMIDMQEDIDDGISSNSTDSLKEASQEALSQASYCYSAVDIIISMNPVANPSNASDVIHIQHSSSKRLNMLLPPTKSDTSSFTMKDHMPNEALNQEFTQQLYYHNLRVTRVSGEGLNCLIHAMIQHAKREYQTQYFKEAAMIREQLQQVYSDVTGMLHVDEHYAGVILKLVNDHCSVQVKIRMVSVVIASSDGPIIYGGTCDERFPAGQNVVIWQQGNHYVSVVHHHDLIQATSHNQVADHDTHEASSIVVPKLTRHQLGALVKVGIVKRSNEATYCISGGLNRIEYALASKVLSKKDKEQVRQFLQLKLEVDFKTLNNFPRQLLHNQHSVLYDDLCRYAVIKLVKVKEDAEHIEKTCRDRYGETGIVLDTNPRFDVECLNECLEQKSIQKLNDDEQKCLITLLQRNLIIKRDILTLKPIYRVVVSEVTPAHSHLVQSAKWLEENQRSGVINYLKLVIQILKNVNTVISVIKSHQSTIRELDTPEITLRRLSDVFEDSIQDKWDVLEWFSDNQCDLIVDLSEQKWSWKTIFTAVGAIALGVAQIAVGAVLLVVTAGTGSFFCNALISEGVSDMIFGIEGLVKGHCNWSQYWDNKKMSIAITVATAGLGAIFARGKEASKYAYKAFGNASKQLVKQTAKETGRSVSKVLAKEVAKKIGKKVAGAIVDAGINLATDAIMSQLSQAIVNMSESIIEWFDTVSQDQELRSRMSEFLQQEHPQNAEKYLHQITIGLLQKHSFLDIWDTIEDKAKTGANVLTEAHGRAASHLHMHGEKLKGSGFMKGIGYISRFAPLLTEMVKSGLIKKRMEDVKTALKQDLIRRTDVKCRLPPLDEARQKQIKDMIDKELGAMKQHYVHEMSQRGKKIVTTGLQILSQEAKKRLVEFGKERLHSLKEAIDMSQLEKYKSKLEAAKSDGSQSQIKKYEKRLQRLMTRTRSPKVFAHMIEHHDALLGPAFAVPALEKIVKRPILIVTEDGKELLNVGHHIEGDPIVVKFIPGNSDQPGHYFYGEEIFTSTQHGNDCLIHAVMAGAGISDIDVRKVRSDIAEACKDSKHPCHRYIKLGIARNYVQIGLVGAGVTYDPNTRKFSGKAEWYSHIDGFLLDEWMRNPANADRSGVDISKWMKGEATLLDLGLNRCHRLSEKSIQQIIERAISQEDVVNVKRLREQLLPTIEEVKSGQSHFQGKAKESFLATYANDNSSHGKMYSDQVERVKKCINNWKEVTGKSKDSKSKLAKLAKDFSNSPINVSLGDSSTNQSVGKAMDYNPGTPRSEGLKKAFFNTKDFLPPKTSQGGYVTSFFTGLPTEEEASSWKKR